MGCLQIGRLPPTFGDAAKIASAIMTSGYEFGSGKIIYNKFKSVVSYQQSDLPLFSQKAVEVCTLHAH
jgi:F-type H+-transporting ATPase subunit gamma